jgi:hypothetical protein
MKFALFLFSFIFLVGLSIKPNSQENPFPNELKGFEFFGKGKLKNLKLGVSTKEDVELIFGDSCENYCDYDESFKVIIKYLVADDCMTTRAIRDRIVCPLDDFVGKVFSVELKPKRPYSFKDFDASKFNARGGGGSVEKGSGASVSYSSFGDEYGLKYSVYNKISSAKESDKSVFVKGDLYSITYSLSEELESKIFKAEFKPKK